MTARYQVKDLANTTTQTAQTALLGTYAGLGQTSSTPTPVIEGDLNNFNHDYEEDGVRTYWYHPDHLGSSSYITNIEGIVTQHLEYMPYGESLVEEHQNSINTPYKFNGKEQDDETGNYYYGARYYNPKFSFWLGVDPLAEIVPDKTQYHYVSNNPINRIDPDGRKDVYHDHEGNQTEVKNDNWFHNFFFGARNYINDEKGENSYRLTDQAFDVMKLEDFAGFDSIWEMSENESGLNQRIEAATENYDPMEENVLPYVIRESGYGGDMDQKLNLDANKIYGFRGEAMNSNEAGNVVWGAAMTVFGASDTFTYLSAHAGTLKIAGRLDEYVESEATVKGVRYMRNTFQGIQLEQKLHKKIYKEWLERNGHTKKW